MKTLSAALCLALGCALPAWADGTGLNVELEALADAVSPAVVALDAQAQTGRLRGSPNVWDFQARPSGFFIDAQGHMLTDASFVGDDTKSLGVRLSGGIRARARVVGVDTLNNVALLALENAEAVARRMGGALPFLTLGRSRGLLPGQTVFSCGNTFDSVTVDGVPSFSRGIVASISRLREDGAYRGVVIETDACINPGTFGGPLLDREGRVVGVVARQFSTRRWLGTAVPIDQVRLGIEALKAGEQVRPGRLGIALESLGGEASAEGLRVTRVVPGSAAAAAGLRAGDRLVALDGRRIRDTGDVADELGLLPAGSPLRVRIRRDGAERQLHAVLDSAGATTVAQLPEQPAMVPAAGGASLGALVEQRAGARGLTVLELRPDGPCARAGIQPGDVLMTLGDARLDSYDALEGALARMRPGQQVTLKVEREGWLREFSVTLGDGTTTATGPTQTREPGFMGVFLLPTGEGGAHVDGAQPGGAAEAAGLVKGDVIVKADGKPIAKATDLVDVLKTKFAGDTITLEVKGADGAVRRTQATLLARGQQAQPQPTPTAQPWLGVALLMQNGRITVDAVAPGSPCAKAGFQKGDVIVAAGGQKLSSLDQFGSIFSGYRVGQQLPLLVERDGWEKDFQLKLEAKR